MFRDINPNTPVVLTIELYLPFLLYSSINLVGVLRASGSLSYELGRVAVELCFKCFALPLTYRDLLQDFSPENGQFLGETLSISSQNLGRKLRKRNAFDPRGWGCYNL